MFRREELRLMRTKTEAAIGEEFETVSLDRFPIRFRKYEITPIVAEVPTKEDALSLYRRLKAISPASFIFEAGGSGEARGRYAHIGLAPHKLFVAEKGKDFLKEVEAYLKERRSESARFPFAGGVAGYFGYEMAGQWENLFHDEPSRELKHDLTPPAMLMEPSVMVIVDSLLQRATIVANVPVEEEGGEAARRLDEARCKVAHVSSIIESGAFAAKKHSKGGTYAGQPISNKSRNSFIEMVRRAKEYIAAGDAFQIVLSQRFYIPTDIPSLDIYETLREGNPSPYLFFFDFDGVEVFGSSPEVLVKVEGDRVITRPLAGTRPRGSSEAADIRLCEELLADEKELAEHVMLIDLARNDLGRVCETGSVRVTEALGIERYSRVMHIVSQVEGVKKAHLSPLEVLRHTFPAGTVSGAPKIRAMELIDELEDAPRGPYAGAVGYVDYQGNMDMSIAIRTFFKVEDKLYLQAGAGVVSDSVPEREYEETLNKARALFEAVKKAKKAEAA
jgi:anthranilate synthase component 1